MTPPRHYWELGWWEVTRREPDPRLRAHLRGPYVGWTECTSRSVRRREVASGVVPLIFNLGQPYRLIAGRDPAGAGEARGSFVAGLYDSHVIVESARSSCGLQVNFTPLGAHLLLGIPMDSLTNRAVELEDILGAEAREIMDRLHDAPSWGERFDIVDAFLLARLTSTHTPCASIAWAWHALEESGGRIGIGALAREIGWSHKHLIQRFRQQIGLPPKIVARILRFERVVHRLRRADVARWTDIALECGYYDQAHLIRDFAEFAGSTPSAFLGLVLDAEGGILDA
jgi:AraC-like DNA-binding protein